MDNLELLRGDHVARGRLDEAKETAETKGELSREDRRHLARHARPTRVMARSCRLAAELRSATHTPLRATPVRQCVWRFSVRRRPGKIKDKERQGRAPRVHLALLLIVF